MSPERLDGYINAWAWTAHQIDTYGPGLAVAAGIAAITWTYQTLRRQFARAADICAWAASTTPDDELAQMAAARDAIETAPLIDTQHGYDRDALRTCKAIWGDDNACEGGDQ